MSTNELGREIRRLLGDRSQTWLAEQIGTTQATVSRIVRGVHRPTPDKLVALARALHVDGTYLLQLAGYPITQAPDRHPEIDYLARRLYELPDYARRPIIDAVAAMVDAAHELSRAHAYHGGELVDSAALYDVAPQEEARPSDAALVEEIIGELGQLSNEEELVRLLTIAYHHDPEGVREVARIRAARRAAAEGRQ